LGCVVLRCGEYGIDGDAGGGWNVLVGADKGRIIEAMKCFYPSGTQKDIFGSAEASGRILNIIANI
jgi:hypothetical protein